MPGPVGSILSALGAQCSRRRASWPRRLGWDRPTPASRDVHAGQNGCPHGGRSNPKGWEGLGKVADMLDRSGLDREHEIDRLLRLQWQHRHRMHRKCAWRCTFSDRRYAGLPALRPTAVEQANAATRSIPTAIRQFRKRHRTTPRLRCRGHQSSTSFMLCGEWPRTLMNALGSGIGIRVRPLAALVAAGMFRPRPSPGNGA